MGGRGVLQVAVITDVTVAFRGLGAHASRVGVGRFVYRISCRFKLCCISLSRCFNLWFVFVFMVYLCLFMVIFGSLFLSFGLW